MNITVYLGALKGNDESLEKAVKELGTFIGTSGNTLIYGGSKSGLNSAMLLSHFPEAREHWRK